ncbi:MAG: DUF2975 domain-containing protein [Bacteroidota bacterium]
MGNVKLISRILFYFTRVIAAFYFIMAAYAAMTLVTGWSISFRESGKYFQVLIPFTKTPILNGDNNLPYIFFEFLGPLSLYGLFFWLLGNVFKVFFQPRLFTGNGIKHLKRFYLGNFIVPGVMVLIVSLIDNPGTEGISVIILHAIIGVFAYFLAAIFKQGLNLQNEQDLII